MKNDKICVSSKLTMLLGVAIVALLLVVGMQYINKDAKTTSSRASAPAAPLKRLSGGLGQACGANDSCNTGLKCYNKKLKSYSSIANSNLKTCQTLESVCGKGEGSPCCAPTTATTSDSACATGMKCLSSSRTLDGTETREYDYDSESANYLRQSRQDGYLITTEQVDPWMTGLCAPIQNKCGGLNKECCGSATDSNRCDSNNLKCGVWFLDGYPSYERCLNVKDLKVLNWRFASRSIDEEQRGTGNGWNLSKDNSTDTIKKYYPYIYVETNIAEDNATLELTCGNKKITYNYTPTATKKEYGGTSIFISEGLYDCLFESGKEYTVTGKITVYNNDMSTKISLPLKSQKVSIE